MVTKLPPNIYASWMFKDAIRFHRWIKLVNLAAVTVCVIELNDRQYECGIGEIVTTRSKLASELGCRVDEARWFLNKLISIGEIEQTSEAKHTRIFLVNFPDYVDLSVSAQKPRAKTKSDAKKKTSKPNKPKQPPTLVTRAREVFEAYYKETFEDAYYWQAKDAVNMQQLLQKISHSRTSRDNPLAIDDDSLLDALNIFLRTINKDFIRNNFSVPKINSYYNDIVSEIKNRKSITTPNVRPTQTPQVGTPADGVNRQKCVVIDKLAKAQREWEEKQRFGDKAE